MTHNKLIDIIRKYFIIYFGSVMENFTLLQQRFYNLLVEHEIQYSEWIALGAVLTIIVICSLLIHYILHKIILNKVKSLGGRSKTSWHKAFFERSLFKRVALGVQGFVIYLQASLWLSNDSVIQSSIHLIAHVWILLFVLLSFHSLLDVILDSSRNSRYYRNFPLRGLFQTIKLISSILFSLLVVSILVGKSPMILLSGLGAMTAILMLVFKDPIMGLVSGIHLSANNMLSVGDWLEMPKYGADGSVVDINLTTVKVRNWDNTITTVPTYALISDSFKNWRGMQESGGRRIKRSIFIDTQTIRFLDKQDIDRLNKSDLLKAYFDQKVNEIEHSNQGKDLSLLINGRRLTNIGTLRAYLIHYLNKHPSIHQGMIIMVRQLESAVNGLPLEIYCFTNTTAWVDYEGIQADIFDHIYSVLSEFDLKIHQAPTGNDVKMIGSFN